jgi:hypothetical protein
MEEPVVRLVGSLAFLTFFHFSFFIFENHDQNKFLEIFEN